MKKLNLFGKAILQNIDAILLDMDFNNKSIDKFKIIWYNLNIKRRKGENKMYFFNYEFLIEMVAYNEITEAEAEEIAIELMKEDNEN